MALENKKIVAKLFLVSLGFYFSTQETQGEKEKNQHSTIKKVTKQKRNSSKNTADKSTNTLSDQELSYREIKDQNVSSEITDTLTSQENTDETTNNSQDVKSDSIISPSYLPTTIDFTKRLSLHDEHRKINEINVSGNIIISKDSIINSSPLKVGDEFSSNYTATMIKNLYKLGYFHQVKVYAAPVGKDKINLLISVQEKPKLKDVTFVGNKAISEKDLKAELKVDKISTLIQGEIKALIVKLKKYYRKKNFHHAQITADLKHDLDGRVSVEFTIKEGKKSYLNRISFKGNKRISGKKLRRAIFSKEDWILGLLDHSGTYNPEMSEGDKYMIEELYKNHGFIQAKVTDTLIEQNPVTQDYHITYTIQEGDRYRIKAVNVQGNHLVSEDRLRAIIPICEGQYYSLENIRSALENLRLIWGEHGYIFADIEPSIETDEKTKLVTISFNSDLKEQVYLNRLTVRGNTKTRDKVIRRNILLNEGELITNIFMEISKSSVSRLGYFDPKNGVNWKTIRIDNAHADLDLVLQEIKTGYFNMNLSFGGSPTNRNSPQTGLSFSCSAGDRNFVGSGVDLSTSADISSKYSSLTTTATNPWMFDKPIKGIANAYIKSSEYDDQIDIAQEAPLERIVGGIVGLGYVSKLLGGINVDGNVSAERITYNSKIKAAQKFNKADQTIAQILLDKNFQTGNQISFIGSLTQDLRNGIAFPTNGHQWKWFTQLTVPGWNSRCNTPHLETGPNRNACFNYFKSELDVTWYTPLINEHDLVLCIHANMGIIKPFKGKDAPWKAFYHMGGPTTIRGYLYGQVGPTWKTDSIGATKGFCANVEFIVPLSSNLNTRGVIFYDGGAGWDTPYFNEFSQAAKDAGLSFQKAFSNNNFVYRHSVGIGIRIKSPTPLQVDFGIKLNPSKLFKNELTQMHLNMVHEF
ncbi:MAG: outer membrane protein assembly factor BamA [Candidatus Dependentiae bacterium]|nr:outer membrane protein assembly factor BamA [Candidatus Dependentiae bacterium]